MIYLVSSEIATTFRPISSKQGSGHVSLSIQKPPWRKPHGFDSHRHKSSYLRSLPGSWELGAGLWWPDQQMQLPESELLPLPLLPTCQVDWKTSAANLPFLPLAAPPGGPSCPLPDLCCGWTLLARCSQDPSPSFFLSVDHSCHTHSLDPGLVQGPAGALMLHILSPEKPLPGPRVGDRK